jgi:hypothetical protein
MIKRQVGKCRRVNLWILLVASAVQGITPSAHNLASHRLFRILSPGSLAAGSYPEQRGRDRDADEIESHRDTPADSAPLVQSQRKKAPGVMCLPARWGPRRNADDAPYLDALAGGPSFTAIHPRWPCPPRRRTTIATSGRSLETLCRMTC